MNYCELEKLVQIVTDKVIRHLENYKPTLQVIGDVEVINNNFRIGNNIENPDLIFISDLSVDMMARIASVCPINDLEKNILNHFLYGKKVYVLKTGIQFYKYRKSSSHTLRKHLDKFEYIWLRYGAEFVSIEEMKCLKPDNNIIKIRSNKIIFTESKIKKLDLIENSIFEIDTNTILTDLAKEYINSKKIKLLIRH